MRLKMNSCYTLLVCIYLKIIIVISLEEFNLALMISISVITIINNFYICDSEIDKNMFSSWFISKKWF